MNNKGFTLLEVILTVAVLAVIVMIITPSIMGLMRKSKEDSYNNLVNSIISAAKTYVSDNRYTLKDDNGVALTCENNIIYISLNTLVESGDLNSPVVDPRTNEDINLNNKVKIEFNCNNKTFNYGYISE